ncbi:MAG: diaminopimelate epimerase [Acidobacteria bacterium]|nr:MAG: diaminopimelate epimerase [Acidobacteriota bacterium]
MGDNSKIIFTKFHGLGNDFIVMNGSNISGNFSRLAHSICERHTGVGADGLLLVQKPRTADNHARVRFFNADGSEAEMSGNGIRCAGAFLVRERRRLHLLRVETASGVKVLELMSGGSRAKQEKWKFQVNMGKPILNPQKIPFVAGKHPSPVIGYPILTTHGILGATVTSMGNPHCSIFVKEFSIIPWEEIGREIERSALFPNRTNVEFVHVLSKNEIEVRYWERGVGKTLSSGTGSCGAVVACILNGFTQRSVKVRTLAGTLEVKWPEDKEVTLAGPVRLIADGVYYPPG